MKNLILGLLLVTIFSFQLKAKSPDAPSEFDTINDIRAWIVSGKGYGEPEFFETDLVRTKVIVGWVDPFSGRSANYAYAYVFSSEKRKWELLDASFIEKDGPISFVYFDNNANQLIYVNHKGRKIRKISVH